MRYYFNPAFLPPDCTTTTFYYINDTIMRAHTSLQSHSMEIRPNSVPNTLFMTGGEVDSYVRGGQRSIDIGTDTDRESSIERLNTRRTQRLQDDRENLKDRLHSYIELRSAQRWTPPRHTAYLTFADRQIFCLMATRDGAAHTRVFGRSRLLLW